MSNRADHRRVGGESIHVGDCQIWAEIYYLDSPTDYREYLPQNHSFRQILAAEMALLDSTPSTRRPKAKHRSRWPMLLLILTISWFLGRLFGFW